MERNDFCRLKLRPFVVEDAEAFFELTRDKDIQKYVPYACPESLIESEDFIKIYYSNCDFVRDYYYIIEEVSTKSMVGALIITENLDRDLELSMLVGKEFRKCGYASEALEMLKDCLAPGKKLYFVIKKTNHASIRTTKKFGARLVKERTTEDEFTYVYFT